MNLKKGNPVKEFIQQKKLVKFIDLYNPNLTI